jgi:hypothetical protein
LWKPTKTAHHFPPYHIGKRLGFARFQGVYHAVVSCFPLTDYSDQKHLTYLPIRFQLVGYVFFYCFRVFPNCIDMVALTPKIVISVSKIHISAFLKYFAVFIPTHRQISSKPRGYRVAFLINYPVNYSTG